MSQHELLNSYRYLLRVNRGVKLAERSSKTWLDWAQDWKAKLKWNSRKQKEFTGCSSTAFSGSFLVVCWVAVLHWSNHILCFIAHQEKIWGFVYVYLCTKYIKMDTTSKFDAVKIILFFLVNNSSSHCWPISKIQFLKQQGVGCGFMEQGCKRWFERF